MRKIKLVLAVVLAVAGCASNDGGADDAPIGFILLPPQAFSGNSSSGFSTSLDLVEGTGIHGASTSVTCGSLSYVMACAKIGHRQWCSPTVSCRGGASLTLSMPRVVVDADHGVKISVTGGPSLFGVEGAVVTFDAQDDL